MSPKAPRRTRTPYPTLLILSEEQEQREDHRRSPPPRKDKPAPGADSVPELESEPEGDEIEDEPARKKANHRIVTNFSEDEKELIIEFLQQNPTLYSKRLAGYRDVAAKDRLWAEQAKEMKRMPYELKTWYDSMRTKLGKLKKATNTSWQAAEYFTPTERWIWQRFQFLLEHITRSRSTAETYSAQLQHGTDAGASHSATAPEPPEDDPPADTPSCSHVSSTGVPDLLMGFLETFLAERQSQMHPTAAFGSYVDGSLRSLPPALRRKAEARIMEVLHECQNEADRRQFPAVQPQ